MIADDSRGPRQPFWNRPFTRRQTLVAYFAVGWTAAFGIMVIGDYQLDRRWPGPVEAFGYAALALVFAPFFAWVAKWKSAGLRGLVNKDSERHE